MVSSLGFAQDSVFRDA